MMVLPTVQTDSSAICCPKIMLCVMSTVTESKTEGKKKENQNSLSRDAC